MATETNEIILEINVRYEDALNGIEQYRAEIERTKKDQETFYAEMKKGLITEKEYNKLISASNATIKQRQADIRTLQKELQNNVKQENALAGSYNQLSAQMSILKNRYKELSAEQRSGEEGEKLIKQINDLNDALKKADADIGVFSRNVGDYEKAIIAAASGGNTFAASLLATASGATSSAGALKSMIGGVKAFGKALTALAANPVIAILSVVIGLFTAFRKVVQSSEESTARFNAILAPLNRIIEALLLVLQKIVGAVLSAVEGFGKFIGVLAQLAERIPGIGREI